MAEDVAEAITRVENVLRDLIEETLRGKYGDDWLAHLGVSEEELDSWRRKQQEDRERRGGEIAEERLLYYADLHDLAPILKRNWQLFSPCLGHLKEIEVYLGKLEDLRPPQAHGRTLLPFEKNLVLGISGDIRQRVTVYRSRQSPESEFFARIESVKDSLGNVLLSAQDDSRTGVVLAKEVLRVADEVIFNCSGWDPNGQALLWALEIIGTPPPRTVQGWSTGDSPVWDVSERDVGESTAAKIYMRSQGRYHSRGNFDGLVMFFYTVLPAPRKPQ